MHRTYPFMLTAAMALLIGPATKLSAAETTARSSRPNFVLIVADDLRFDAMSCAGHPFVKTPNIDKLATSGARFTNAFVTLSLCAPSRAVMMTSVYSHLNGVPTNEGQEFDPKEFPTFPMLLQQAGYETAFVGKWHMKPISAPRPGFDDWFSFRGQGQYIDPELNDNGRKFVAKGYMTDLLTEHAVAFLKKSREKPFCLCLWHKAVHGPFTPAERHQNLYKDAELPEPPNFQDNLASKPEWQRARFAPGGQKNRRPGATVPAEAPPAKWDGRAEGMMNYFRAEAAIDDSVGQVLQTLKDIGQIDNTYVIFSSDNGYFHGEHHRSDKRAAYEESVRIPLVMQGPGLAQHGGLIDQMVLNLDFGPTILDLAGVKPAPTMQGRSFKPLLAGQSPEWRSAFLYEYYQEKMLPGVPTMVGVRTADWKYVTYPEIKDIDELYDLRKDPHEMKNLATDPEARGKLEEMKKELEKVKKETRYRSPGRAE